MSRRKKGLNLNRAKDLISNPNTDQKKEDGLQAPAHSKRPLFGHLNTDLQSALNSWEDLTEKTSDKASPDQEQLTEVKRLLGELKNKLKEFGD